VEQVVVVVGSSAAQVQVQPGWEQEQMAVISAFLRQTDFVTLPE
jgi:hypothetical protein